MGGLFFSTFMGGSDATWGPSRDQYARFKNFAVYSASMCLTARVRAMACLRFSHRPTLVDAYAVSSLAPSTVSIDGSSQPGQTASDPGQTQGGQGGQVGVGVVTNALVLQVSPPLATVCVPRPNACVYNGTGR